MDNKEYQVAFQKAIENNDKELTDVRMVTTEFFNQIRKKEEELFAIALRTTAIPPIKGGITKGKIRWRGIRRVKQHEGMEFYSWLEQRGTQISPKFTVSIKI